MPPIDVLGRPLDEREAFRNLIEALKVAEASAKQIAYLRGQKQWLSVEFALAGVREKATVMALAR